MDFTRASRFSTALATAATVASATAAALFVPVAHAQLPPGLDPALLQQSIPSQIEVPAGETTTVDVGVPVQANYNSEGWAVSSNGTTVTVSAPNTPGATVSVPASAAGYTATVTLVAVGGVQPQEDNQSVEAPTGPEPATPAPEVRRDRTPAAGVDTAPAKIIHFNGQIDGNVITVKVSFGQAADLMKYAGADREGAKLRYLDVNGRIIEGVKRDIDPATRTLTLTYPPEETPDNPFIMEVVRDGTTSEFIAVITSSNSPSEAAEEDNPYAKFGADRVDGTGGNTQSADSAAAGAEEGEPATTLVVTVGALALAAIVGLLVLLSRRRGK
ncbi:hypothetical protein G7Y29_05165 [Corynebacterium qintianiae]|uniref:Uncharacterized protein n=1 Tax=Corynebacterium qintianiae TaxID=2709392 RepID=A0A7T0PGR5_9CORY|nr:hypothetical protein [Corynebacterium qintianiae]QPK84152.1 hypothetical protein G7Y29_05165 [Corynebacterium qintianiae]